MLPALGANSTDPQSPQPVYVCDAEVTQQLIEKRRAEGTDLLDEVWEGVYIVSPLGDNVHQSLGSRMAYALQDGLGLDAGAQVFTQVNVSDRRDGWQENFRCPDVAVFLPDTAAEDCQTHWRGGPDLVIEIVSPNDLTREKLGFYAEAGVRELLIVDRRPWALELFRLANGSLESVAASPLEADSELSSEVVPFSFRLEPGAPRPRVIVTHADGRTWAA